MSNVPCTLYAPQQVNHGDEAQLASYPSSQDPWAAKACAAAKNAVGLPVGVQVVALPHEDETCLFAMKEIELAVQCCLSGGLK
jgi:Asp-tRNA(Asn)/Glu-tRNA(Gln) amidotransferase A subunit family amidase